MGETSGKKKNIVKVIEKGTGWIEVICGSMFSGKSEELIRRLRRGKDSQAEGSGI